MSCNQKKEVNLISIPIFFILNHDLTKLNFAKLWILSLYQYPYCFTVIHKTSDLNFDASFVANIS